MLNSRLFWKADSLDAQPDYSGPLLRDIPFVLVRLTRASICESDRRVQRGAKESALGSGEIVLGHEGGGYVVDAGPYSAELPAGSKVVILPHLTCGEPECMACRSGRTCLCPRMRHLGFHVNGVFAELMAFPRSCLLKVEADFPDDALPLVEPLACVLRALDRIQDDLARLAFSNPTDQVTLFGAGPMGCLIGKALVRHRPGIRICQVDPNPIRRCIAAGILPEVEVVAELPLSCVGSLAFVVTSAYTAACSAEASTQDGGTILLFAGINAEALTAADSAVRRRANFYEEIHRTEKIARATDPLMAKTLTLKGSSGFNLENAQAAVQELRQFYSHYAPIQNGSIAGLASQDAQIAGKQYTFPHEVAATALLAPKSLDDATYGEPISCLCKVIIRLA